MFSSFFHFLLPGGADSRNDLVHHGRIGQGRGVTQAVLLAAQDLTQDTAHDLAAASLGEVVDDEDSLGGGEGTNGLADLHHEVLAELLAAVVVLLEGNEGIDGLTGEFIRNTNDGSFGNQGCFELVVILFPLKMKQGNLRCSMRAASISAVERR